MVFSNYAFLFNHAHSLDLNAGTLVDLRYVSEIDTERGRYVTTLENILYVHIRYGLLFHIQACLKKSQLASSTRSLARRAY